MHKAVVKDDFIKYVAPTLKPLTQEAIEKSFLLYAKVMFEEGEISYRNYRSWKVRGSGLRLNMVKRRLEELPCHINARKKQRVAYIRNRTLI